MKTSNDDQIFDELRELSRKKNIHERKEGNNEGLVNYSRNSR